jgi:uncharacterized protein DUF2442
MSKMIRVATVRPLEGFCVRIGFTDGSERDFDLECYLNGPIFEPMRLDPALFREIRVDYGTVAWPNGADIDPDVLYLGLTPASWETPDR